MPKETNPNNTGRGYFEQKHLDERNEAWAFTTLTPQIIKVDAETFDRFVQMVEDG